MSDSDAILECPRCRGVHTVKNGHTRKGRQLMLCRDCHKFFVPNPLVVHYSDAFKAQVLAALDAGVSQRRLEREYGVRRKTIANWRNSTQATPEIHHEMDTKTVVFQKILAESRN